MFALTARTLACIGISLVLTVMQALLILKAGSAEEPAAVGFPEARELTLAPDPLVLGPSLPVKNYGSREAWRWGLDFIFAPTNAKDRVILYAYGLNNTDDEFFAKFEELILTQRPRLALISIPQKRNFVFLGNEQGTYGVPVLLDPTDAALVRSFVSTLRLSKEGDHFIPAVVAAAALKTLGVDLDSIDDASKITFLRAWKGKIATSVPVAGTYKSTAFVASVAGWDATKNPFEAYSRLSDLKHLFDR